MYNVHQQATIASATGLGNARASAARQLKTRGGSGLDVAKSTDRRERENRSAGRSDSFLGGATGVLSSVAENPASKGGRKSLVQIGKGVPLGKLPGERTKSPVDFSTAQR